MLICQPRLYCFPVINTTHFTQTHFILEDPVQLFFGFLKFWLTSFGLKYSMGKSKNDREKCNLQNKIELKQHK